MRISREQRNVPLKFHAEAGTRLFLGCRLMTIIHMCPKIGMRRQSSKPRGMVLYGMCTDDSKRIRLPLAQFQQPFISMIAFQALPGRHKIPIHLTHTCLESQKIRACINEIAQLLGNQPHHIPQPHQCGGDLLNRTACCQASGVNLPRVWNHARLCTLLFLPSETIRPNPP